MAIEGWKGAPKPPKKAGGAAASGRNATEKGEGRISPLNIIYCCQVLVLMSADLVVFLMVKMIRGFRWLKNSVKPYLGHQ